MAVEPLTKKKVRFILDFHELNQIVEYHTGDDLIENCEETLRKWRQGGRLALMYHLLTLKLLAYKLRLRNIFGNNK